MKKISVVVCAKNEEKYIENCLKCLASQEIPCEIVVVDGHSKDKTIEISKKYANKIVFDHGKGISDARNVGFETASCEIVAYCDADSLPPKNWTKKILEHMEGKYCVSGPLIPYDGSLITKINMNVWANFYPRIMSKLGYQNVWGANMAFRKTILKNYPFKVRFLEDYDIGIRLRKTFKIKFYGDLKLPTSSRRFENGFIRTCIKYYIREWINRKLKNKTTTGYY